MCLHDYISVNVYICVYIRTIHVYVYCTHAEACIAPQALCMQYVQCTYIFGYSVCVCIYMLNMGNVSCLIHSRRRKAKRTPKVVTNVTTMTMTRRLLHMKAARVREKRVPGRQKK